MKPEDAAQNFVVLHVRDRAERRGELRRALEADGYAYLLTQNLRGAGRLISEQMPDVILLEQSSRLAVTDFLRDRLQDPHGPMPVPVIVLGENDEADELVALALGADDYIPAQSSPKRILARIKSVVRRGAPPSPDSVLESGPVRLDVRRYEATINSVAVPLTPAEFRVLHEVVSGNGRVVPRSQLMLRAFGVDGATESRRIDVHVVGLRRKLGSAAAWLHTVRALGYAWRDPHPHLAANAHAQARLAGG